MSVPCTNLRPGSRLIHRNPPSILSIDVPQPPQPHARHDTFPLGQPHTQRRPPRIDRHRHRPAHRTVRRPYQRPVPSLRARPSWSASPSSHETLSSALLSMALLTLGLASATLAGSLAAQWTPLVLLVTLIAAINLRPALRPQRHRRLDGPAMRDLRHHRGLLPRVDCTTPSAAPRWSSPAAPSRCWSSPPFTSSSTLRSKPPHRPCLTA